jgi:hypothetical protein
MEALYLLRASPRLRRAFLDEKVNLVETQDSPI